MKYSNQRIEKQFIDYLNNKLGYALWSDKRIRWSKLELKLNNELRGDVNEELLIALYSCITK